MFADAHIVDALQVEVFEVIDHRFALRVEQFFVGHDVDFGDKFHVVGKIAVAQALTR